MHNHKVPYVLQIISYENIPILNLGKYSTYREREREREKLILAPCDMLAMKNCKNVPIKLPISTYPHLPMTELIN